MQSSGEQYEFFVELPPLGWASDPVPGAAHDVSETRHGGDEAYSEKDRVLAFACTEDEAFAQPLGLRPHPPHPVVRWALVVVYLSLIITITHLAYNYIAIFRQLVDTRASLEVADQRADFLAERVAWLEARLEYANSEAAEEELASTTSGGLEMFEWRDTIDLAITAIELEGRVEDLEHKLAKCRMEEVRVPGSAGVGQEVYGLSF